MDVVMGYSLAHGSLSGALNKILLLLRNTQVC